MLAEQACACAYELYARAYVFLRLDIKVDRFTSRYCCTHDVGLAEVKHDHRSSRFSAFLEVCVYSSMYSSIAVNI